MKTKSKEELKQIAREVFTKFPKANNLACTADGMAFITDESSHNVKNHSVKNKYGKVLTITNYTRDETMTEIKISKAEELIAEIEAATEAVVVEKILADENSGKKRSTVIKAGEAKLAILKGGN